MHVLLTSVDKEHQATQERLVLTYPLRGSIPNSLNCIQPFNQPDQWASFDEREVDLTVYLSFSCLITSLLLCPWRSVGVHCSGAGCLPAVSWPEGHVLRSLGPHGAAVCLLWPPQSKLQHGAGTMDHCVPQVRMPNCESRVGSSSLFLVIVTWLSKRKSKRNSHSHFPLLH